MTARKVELDAPQRLLDIAGGSGAFTITLCRKYPELQATIVDYPAVTDVAHAIQSAGMKSSRQVSAFMLSVSEYEIPERSNSSMVTNTVEMMASLHPTLRHV